MMRIGCFAVALAVALVPPAVGAHETALVVERARDALHTALRSRNPGIQRFDLALIGTSRASLAALDVDSLEVVLPNDVPLGKRGCVLLRQKNAADEAPRTALWWSVKAFGPVLATRRAIRAGELVRADDVALETRDVAGLGGLIVEPATLSAGQRARRFIAAGSPLRESDIDPVPEVAREQQVKVKIAAGAVQIETVGVASAEGRVGDVISVTNPASGMRYPARVTGAGEVTVGRRPQ